MIMRTRLRKRSKFDSLKYSRNQVDKIKQRKIKKGEEKKMTG